MKRQNQFNLFVLFSFQHTFLISPRGGMSSAMYGWGGEAFFCPRRLPSRENARGERWPYAGAPLTIRIYAPLKIRIYAGVPLTIRIYVGATLTIRRGTTPAITALPLRNSLIYGCQLYILSHGYFQGPHLCCWNQSNTTDVLTLHWLQWLL